MIVTNGTTIHGDASQRIKYPAADSGLSSGDDDWSYAPHPEMYEIPAVGQSQLSSEIGSIPYITPKPLIMNSPDKSQTITTPLLLLR